jgi:hypothetical protein
MSNSLTLSYTQLIILAVAPVLLGGLIGVTGSLLGPWLLEGRKEAAEKKRRRAEKFEELVATVYEHEHWLDTMKNIRLFGYQDRTVVSPFAKIQSISSVYFPEFDKRIEELNKCASHYETWMLKAAVKRTAKDFAENRDGLIEGAVEAYNPYIVQRGTLLRELKDYAKREFQ